MIAALDLGRAHAPGGALYRDLSPPARLDLAEPEGRDRVGDAASLDRTRRPERRRAEQRALSEIRRRTFHEITEGQDVAACRDVAAEAEPLAVILRENLHGHEAEGRQGEEGAHHDAGGERGGAP